MVLSVVEAGSVAVAEIVLTSVAGVVVAWTVCGDVIPALMTGRDGKISQQKLWEFNPTLGKNGENCTTHVWLNYYYCVASKGDGSDPVPSSTTTTTATTTATPKPTATQEGIDPNCNKFIQAKEGDGCSSLATGAGIKLAQFHQWNTAVGLDGEDCNTQIWVNYYYCVDVSNATPTTTTRSPTATTAAPLPTRIKIIKILQDVMYLPTVPPRLAFRGLIIDEEHADSPYLSW